MQNFLQALAVDPLYSSRKTHYLALGDEHGCVYLVSKGWLGPSTTIIFKGKYRIRDIQWRNNLLAWSSKSGVRIYDTSTHTPVGSVDMLRGLQHNNHIHIRWMMADSILLIGWGENLLEARIYSESKDNEQNPISVRKTIKARKLCCTKEESSLRSIGSAGPVPLFITLQGSQILVQSVENGHAGTIVQDSFPIKYARPDVDMYFQSRPDFLSYKDSKLDDVSQPSMLGPSGADLEFRNDQEAIFFLRTSEEVVGVKFVDSKSRLEWLLQHHRYEEAIQILSRDSSICFEERHKIRQDLIAHLLDSGDYDRAGSCAPDLLQDDKTSWERLITNFARASKLPLIALNIPHKNCILSRSSYDLVLAACLQQKGECH